ncbi:cadherin-like domain-containing protein [Aeromonas hydrophila]|uniref:cadherin-like domain-containing protein n=1 Tax=Aeromonas hydrophila TaxID=644 RepID=UPI003F79961E
MVDIATDTLETTEDKAVTLNVLTNDSFENTKAAITAVTQGANGSVSFDANGEVTYTPNANFHGADSFSYTVTSGGVTETITVNVNVGEVDGIRPPSPVIPVVKVQRMAAPSLHSQCYRRRWFGGWHGIWRQRQSGQRHRHLDPVTGAWSYTPVADWHGNDSFYRHHHR